MMRTRLAIFLFLGGAAVFGLLFARQLILSRGLPREEFKDRVVQVLTYSTFVSANGPGPELIRSFEAQCRCKVEVIASSDAGILLERLKITGADVVIGLDQLLLSQARENFVWHSLAIDDVEWQEPVRPYADGSFVPFDWSPMAFVYREDGEAVPRTFAEMADAKYARQFALQDPRASTPGLQFLNWVRSVQGKNTVEFLRLFKGNVHTVAPSWSFSYGLFKKREVRFVFSYLTSLAFHWGVENDRAYRVLRLPEGHPVQVELAAVPAQCRECELGADFVRHMLTPESQKLIMEKNFMLPARRGVDAGTVFADLPELKLRPTDGGKDFSGWDQVFSK